MADIVLTIVGDRGIRLGDEQFIRRMAMGSNWNRIRIGCTLVFDASGNVSAAGFALGACNGLVNYTDAGAEVVAAHIGNALFNSTYTYTAGPPKRLSGGSNPRSAITKVGGVETLAAGSATASVVSSDITGSRSAMFCDIRKVGGNATISVTNWLPVSAAVPNWTRYKFLQDLQADATPTYTDATIEGTTSSIAYVGTGNLDCVFIRWNQASPTVEITNLTVVRYA